MRLFDTHCHLNDRNAFPDPEGAAREAIASGVERMCVVGIGPEWNREAIRLSGSVAGVYAVVGWHPTTPGVYGDHEHAELTEMLHRPEVVALGEIGLDYHWDTTAREEQFARLHRQLDLARELDLPIVFHCREAWDDLLDVLEARGPGPYLLHCFSGTWSHAERALALGATFGVDGPITYPKATETRELFARLPLESIVLETDSPWLSPVPHRGKPNRPEYVRFVCEKLAEARGMTAEEVAEATWSNACRFFRRH